MSAIWLKPLLGRTLAGEKTMDFKKGTFELSFQDNELWDLGYHIYNNLERSISEHYNKLQQEQDGESVFYEHNKNNINMMNKFFELVGRRDMPEMFEERFKKMFADKRAERAKVSA